MTTIASYGYGRLLVNVTERDDTDDMTYQPVGYPKTSWNRHDMHELRCVVKYALISSQLDQGETGQHTLASPVICQE